MTAQVPERLFFEGREYGMATEPLRGYLARHWKKLRFRPSSTALWRGYIGTWEIRDGRLFLIDLDATLSDGTAVNLPLLFPDAPVRQLEGMSRSDHLKLLGRWLLEKGKDPLKLLSLRASPLSDAGWMSPRRTPPRVSRTVFANWFTGDLRAPYGKLVEYVHAGYASVYEKELRISIAQGVVKEVIRFDVASPSAQS